jgi:CRISPR/Cas system-associated exonuclease Cas4 (RecB family)
MSIKDLAKLAKQQDKDNNKSLPERFVSSLDQFIVDSRTKERKAQRQTWIRPSMFHKCMRYQWYKILNYPYSNKSTARGERVFETGSALHEWVQTDVIGRSDSPIEILSAKDCPNYGQEGFTIFDDNHRNLMEISFVSTKFTNKYELRGSCDGIIKFEGIPYIFEFKTIKQEDYNLLFEAKREHRMQAAVYALNFGVDEIMFLYINKNTQEWKAFPVTITLAQKEWVIERSMKLDTMLVNNELPEREESETCKWCEYAKICKKDTRCGLIVGEDGYYIQDGVNCDGY